MLFVMEWLPTQTSHKTYPLTLPASTTKNPYTVDMNGDNTPNLNEIWIPLPYIGKHGIKLANSFIRKITPLLKSQCKIIINWQTTDANSFVPHKDPTPNTKAQFFYEFKCPGCNAKSQTTLEKPIVAFTQELKNTPLKTLFNCIIT